MTRPLSVATAILFCVIAILQPFTPASADIVLSQLIVELQPSKHAREDIEVWNNGPERAYVALEPREVVNPGLSNESRREDPDPEKLGLLVSPARMILEPGQRKLARVAALGLTGERERVYRVTVKPVAGPLSAPTSALKILIGYDVLVLVRPTDAHPSVTATRSGNSMTFRNEGNASVELTRGRQCDSGQSHCVDLPGKRLYAGARWTETLRSDAPVEYVVKSPAGEVPTRF